MKALMKLLAPCLLIVLGNKAIAQNKASDFEVANRLIHFYENSETMNADSDYCEGFYSPNNPSEGLSSVYPPAFYNTFKGMTLVPWTQAVPSSCAWEESSCGLFTTPVTNGFLYLLDVSNAGWRGTSYRLLRTNNPDLMQGNLEHNVSKFEQIMPRSFSGGFLCQPYYIWNYMGETYTFGKDFTKSIGNISAYNLSENKPRLVNTIVKRPFTDNGKLSVSETAVFHNPELAAQDIEISKLYRAALNSFSSAEVNKIRTAQREFLRMRNTLKGNYNLINDLQTQRIEALQVKIEIKEARQSNQTPQDKPASELIKRLQGTWVGKTYIFSNNAYGPPEGQFTISINPNGVGLTYRVSDQDLSDTNPFARFADFNCNSTCPTIELLFEIEPMMTVTNTNYAKKHFDYNPSYGSMGGDSFRVPYLLTYTLIRLKNADKYAYLVFSENSEQEQRLFFSLGEEEYIENIFVRDAFELELAK
ncbi:DUF1311 domain-containing protein [Paraferrimonas haliotis]|uniref:DUF1311 domain-containing protein n=1 Tax=Paraferrimonas haliotis TaxID=2013866 RepID=UPI000F7945F4|nr:DUF1311 domain-containing protein [Paraferrimonas haliotis]